MGPESKTLRNTSSRHIGLVDAVVKLKPKKMVKDEMTGGNREQGRRKHTREYPTASLGTLAPRNLSSSVPTLYHSNTEKIVYDLNI